MKRTGKRLLALLLLLTMCLSLFPTTALAEVFEEPVSSEKPVSVEVTDPTEVPIPEEELGEPYFDDPVNDEETDEDLPHKPEESPSSAVAPNGYQPLFSISDDTLGMDASLGQGEPADVLLIQTTLPWESYANTTVLSSLQSQGKIKGYEILSLTDSTGVDFSAFKLIIIANEQTDEFYDQYELIRTRIEDYVYHGGSVCFGACDQGWNESTFDVVLPGGVEKYHLYSNYNYIADFGSPLVTGELTDNVELTNDMLYHNYCSHTCFKEDTLPDNAHVLLRSSDDNAPTLVSYSFGKGQILASGLTWEHAYIYDGAFASAAMDDYFMLCYSQSGGVSDSELTPIIIIPGIMGSKLYLDESCTDMVWGRDDLLFVPTLLSSGSNLQHDVDLYTRGRNGLFLETNSDKEYGTVDTYKNLVDALMDRYPNRRIYFYSYDWRFSNVESARNLSRAMSNNGISRAVFLCHSMGGLVLSNFVANGNQNRVRKSITFGTPYEGAPRLLQAMLTNTAIDSFFGDIILWLSGLSFDIKRELAGLAELSPNTLYNQYAPEQIQYKYTHVDESRTLVVDRLPLTSYPSNGNALRLWFATPSSFNKAESAQKQQIKEWMDGLNSNGETLKDVKVTINTTTVSFTPTMLSPESYEAAYRQIFNTSSCKYDRDLVPALQNVQVGIEILQGMDNAYFVIGDTKKTMSGVKLVRDLSGKIIFSDSTTLPVGDGTVPFASANQYKSAAINERARYFDLNHGGLVGDKFKAGNKEEIQKVYQWVFSIIDGKPRTDLGSTTPRVSSDGRTKLRVACPVEVTVTRDGESLSSWAGQLTQEASFGTLDLGGENGEIKIFNLDLYDDYEILIEGTDEGTMDYTLSFYDENNMLIEERSADAVPITDETIITTDADQARPGALNIDSDGNGTVDEVVLLSSSNPRFTAIALSQNYLLMAQGQTCTLDTTLVLDELASSVRWTVTDADSILFDEDPIITVDEMTGEIIALREGTAYVYASFNNGSEVFYDYCRIDVTAVEAGLGEEEEPSPATRILYASLPEKKVSLELFSTDYAVFDVLLELEQLRNPTASLRPADELPALEDHGLAISEARFQDDAVAALFDLRIVDDRTLLVVPKYETLEQAAASAKAVKGSYSSAVVVTVGDQDFVTQDAAGKPVKLMLSVGKKKPVVKATELKFNSFVPNQALPLNFTGGRVIAVERDEAAATKNFKKDAENWLELDSETQTARLRDGVDGKQSGILYLIVTVEGWATKQNVAVKVSATRTVPKLKLESNSVTLLPGTEDRITIAYSLSPTIFIDAKPAVTRIVEGSTDLTDAEYVFCTPEDGQVTVTAPTAREDGAAHTYKVYLGLNGYEFPVPIEVKTLKRDTVPVLSVKASGAIDTGIPNSPIALKLSLNNYHLGSGEQYNVNVRQQRPAKGDSVAIDRSVNHLLDIRIADGVVTLTEKEPGSLESGFTYTAYVSLDIGDTTTNEVKTKLSVKWTDPAKVKVSGSLKAAGKIDPTRPETSILLTPSFENCFGYEPQASDLAFYRSYKDPATKKTVTVPADEFFRTEVEDGSFRVWLTAAKPFTKADKFRVELHFTANGADYVTPQLTLTVKPGSVKLNTSSAALILLARDRFDSANFRITAADPALTGFASATLDAKSAELFELVNLGGGSYSLTYKDHLVPTVAKAGKNFTVKLTITFEGAPVDFTSTVSLKVNIC